MSNFVLEGLYLSREDKRNEKDPQLQARWKMLPDGIKIALFAEAYQKGYGAFQGDSNKSLRENLWAGIEALEQRNFNKAATHFQEVAELIEHNPLDDAAYQERHKQTVVYMKRGIEQMQNSNQQGKPPPIDLKGFVTQAMRGALER